MKNLQTYISEKLIVNRNYKNINSKLLIPNNVHITGEETCKNIINTINEETENQKSDKVNDWFKGMHSNILKYCYCDITECDEHDYEKAIGKIFPNGLRNYMPKEYTNFESDDEYIPTNWDEYSSLAKFEIDDGKYVIVWIMKTKVMGNEHTLIYVFI